MKPQIGCFPLFSNLFGVSIDYLLKEEREEKGESKENIISDSGYYVSQEMLDGYLSYNRQNVNRVTGRNVYVH